MSDPQIPLFNGTNWDKWHIPMQCLLSIKKMSKYLIKLPAAATASDSKEADEDAIAQAYLKLHMVTDISKTLTSKTTAKAIWDHLTSVYAGSSVKQFAECMSKMLTLINKIDATNPRPQMREMVSRISEAKARQESETVDWNTVWVCILIASIPDCMSALRLGLTAIKDVTWEHASQAVLEECNRESNAKDIIAASQHKKGNGKSLWCEYCRKTSHSTDRCWSKRRNQDNHQISNNQSNSRAEQTTHSFSNNSNSNTTGNFQRRKLGALRMCGVKPQIRTKWYLDSGSCGHMSPVQDGFLTFGPPSAQFETAVGQDVNVRASGRFLLRTRGLDFELEECHYAPDLIGGFVSASQLNRHGYDVLLKHDSTFHILENGETLAGGIERDGMYEFHMVEDSRPTIAATRPSIPLQIG